MYDLYLIVLYQHTYSHPLCMSFGFLVFLTEGLLCYNDGSLPQALFPIMKGPSRSLEAQKRKTRVIHRSLQFIGTILIFFGVAFLLAHKVREGSRRKFQTQEEHANQPSSFMILFPHSWHGWMGCFAILILLIQSISGVVKVQNSIPLSLSLAHF